MDIITSSIVKVTPEVAEEWLKLNTRNRKVKRSYVTYLANEMLAGRWRTTHQGIAFNCDGTLLDGQHRLEAIIEAQTSVMMMVTRGLPSDSQIVMDDHSKRTPHDALSIAGRNIDKNDTAIAIAMMTHRVTTRHDSRRMSKQVLAEFIDRHVNAIMFAKANLWKHGAKRGLTNATVAAAIGKAYYHREHSHLERFCEVFISGEMANPDEVAAVTIRNFCLTMVGRLGGSQGRIELYSKSARCVKAFCDGEQLRKCVASSEDFFPIN